MKTKIFFYSLTTIVLAIAMSLSSCKKKQTVQPSTEDGQSSSDNRNVQNENDLASQDANNAIGNIANLHGRSSGAAGTNTVSICGATIDTTGAYTGTIKLNYDGVTSCSNRKRSGSIRLTVQDYALGKRWKNAGCVVKVEYLAYKVIRTSDNASVQLDGTQMITNNSGGSWWELLIVKTQTTLATSVAGTNLNVTFNDGKTAVYNINRKVTYTLPNNVLTCTGEGIGSNNGLSNLENYGTTRNGEAFTSQVTTPIVWNWTCGSFAPIQGAVDIVVAGKGFDLKCTFGTDAQGNPVNVAANACPYGWKIEWTYNNTSNKKVLGYI